MTNEPAAWPLSEIAAQQINLRRRAAELTREQLAEACRKAGGPESLSASAIANIETGRPDATGRRRRDLTVEELVIFGRALGVPPLLLLFPFDRVRNVEVLPGAVASTWAAAEWFAGRAAFPAEETFIAEYGVYEKGSVAVELWEQHERILVKWRLAEQTSRQAQHAAEVAVELGVRREEAAVELGMRREAETIANTLWGIRRQMRQHGILTPELPDELAHIDTDKSLLQRAVERHYGQTQESQE